MVPFMKSRNDRCVDHVVFMGNSRGVYKHLLFKLIEKRHHGRPIIRWKDNITKDLLRIGCWGKELDHGCSR